MKVLRASISLSGLGIDGVSCGRLFHFGRMFAGVLLVAVLLVGCDGDGSGGPGDAGTEDPGTDLGSDAVDDGDLEEDESTALDLEEDESTALDLEDDESTALDLEDDESTALDLEDDDVGDLSDPDASPTSCDGPEDCASEFCVDGVCCDEACDSPCRSCATGICTVVINAEDDPQCLGDHVCDAAATCALANGQGCEGDEECASRFCVDETCCHTACDDPCFSCTTGVCKSVRGADDDPQCTGDYRCSMAAICGLKNGRGCDLGDDCASGFCQDHTCCATSCGEPCFSCTTGTCLAVTDGVDDPECTVESTCNDLGECRLVDGQACDTGDDCESGFCQDDTCCATSCGEPCFSCTTGTCLVVTDGVDDPECTVESTCNSLGECRLIDGQACDAGDDCESGFCQDDTCCATSCGEPCFSCVTGSCVAVIGGDDESECAGTHTCNASGECGLKDGQPCTPGGDECASGLCVDDTCCPEACDGVCRSCETGVCLPVRNQDDDTCTGASTCNNAGQCLLDEGEGCDTGIECASEFCVDGVCCDEACDSPCRSCGTGICTVVINAEDDPQCMGDHTCDAAATCRLANGQGCEGDEECASRFCVDETCCHTTCDDPCFSCTTGVCKSIRWADDDPQCTGEYTCSLAAICGLKNGRGCDLADDCASGFCEDHTCCEKSCGEPCFSCTTGTCLAVTGGVDEPECSGEFTCNDLGECRLIDGQGCDTGDDCASGFCEDDTCCATTCDAPCWSCVTGTCIAVTGGDDVPECTGTHTCNAGGSCGLKNGQPCTPEDYCASELCVDETCCPVLCGDPCFSCVTGSCVAVTDADDIPECTGEMTCDDSGQCLLADGQECGADGDCASGFCVDLVCASPPTVTCATVPSGREDSFHGRLDDDEEDPLTYTTYLDQIRCWFSEPMQFGPDCFELASDPPEADFGSTRQWEYLYTDDEIYLTPGFDPNDLAIFQACRDGLQRMDLVVLIPPEGDAYVDWFVTMTRELPGRIETIEIEVETDLFDSAEDVAEYIYDDLDYLADHLVAAFVLGDQTIWGPSNVVRLVGLEPNIRFSIETEVREPSRDECDTTAPDCPAGEPFVLDPGWVCHDPTPDDGKSDGFCRGPICGSEFTTCTEILDQTPIAADPFGEDDPGDENLTEPGDGRRRDEIYLYGFTTDHTFQLCIDHPAHGSYSCNACVTVTEATPWAAGEALYDAIDGINSTYQAIYDVGLTPMIFEFGEDEDAVTVIRLEADSPSDEWALTLDVELDGDDHDSCSGSCANTNETCWDPDHDEGTPNSFCVDTCLEGETWVRCDGSCSPEAVECVDDWDQTLTSDVHCTHPEVADPNGCTSVAGLNAQTWLNWWYPGSALYAGGTERGGWDCQLPDGDTIWELQFGQPGNTACVALDSGLPPEAYTFLFTTADIEPPSLVAVTPGPDAVVPFGEPVVIEFDEPMDTQSTLGDIFICFDPDGEPELSDPCDCIDNDDDGDVDEGCLAGYFDPDFWSQYDCYPMERASWSANGTTVTFTPMSWDLPDACATIGCEVFVQVGYVNQDVLDGRAQDVAGNNLVPAAPYPASLEEMQHRHGFVMYPQDWVCGPSAYRDGNCDCGCGTPDPECGGPYESWCAVDHCLEGTSPVENMNWLCSVSGDPQWSCDPLLYQDGTDCNCGCGILDPDCAGPESSWCDFVNCPSGTSPHQDQNWLCI